MAKYNYGYGDNLYQVQQIRRAERQAALRKGDVTYQSAIACPRCGTYVRYSSGSKCRACVLNDKRRVYYGPNGKPTGKGMLKVQRRARKTMRDCIDVFYKSERLGVILDRGPAGYEPLGTMVMAPQFYPTLRKAIEKVIGAYVRVHPVIGQTIRRAFERGAVIYDVEETTDHPPPLSEVECGDNHRNGDIEVLDHGLPTGIEGE